MLILKRQSGFTLIELLVSVAILGILTAMSFPYFGAIIQNSRIQAAAHSVLNGLQQARAEAIRRNIPVEFDLSSGLVDITQLNAVVTDTAGQNWMVRAIYPAGNVFIESKTSQESGLQHVQVSGSVGAVTFSGLGTASTAATFSFANSTGGACAPAGPMRCLRVMVSPGGQSRVCDPAAAAGDNRRC